MNSRLLILAGILAASTALAEPDSPTAASASPPQPSAAPATSQSPAPTTSKDAEENSASYTVGYSDGCASANLRYARQAHVKPNRDSNLYDSDAAYHHGWDHGYRKCEDKITPGGIAIPGNSVVM